MLILAVKQHACLTDDKMMSNSIISQSLKDKRCMTLDWFQQAAFIHIFSRYRDQSRTRSKVRNQRLHRKWLGLFLIQNFFPLALAQPLQCRSEEVSLCPALAGKNWSVFFFVFLGIIMGKYHSQRQRINTAAVGLIAVGWRDEKEPFIKLQELLERIKASEVSKKHRGSSELHFKTSNALF